MSIEHFRTVLTDFAHISCWVKLTSHSMHWALGHQICRCSLTPLSHLSLTPVDPKGPSLNPQIPLFLWYLVLSMQKEKDRFSLACKG